MSWESIQQFFRDNPRAWLVGAAAVLTLLLTVWGVWGGFSLQFGKSSAASVPDGERCGSLKEGVCQAIACPASNPPVISGSGDCASGICCAGIALALIPNGESCGAGNAGTCQAAACPSDHPAVTGGNACIAGNSCCATAATAPPSGPPGGGTTFCNTGFFTLAQNEEWDSNCVEGQNTINLASPYFAQANVDACHPQNLHLVWSAAHRNKATCDPFAAGGPATGITTDVTNFTNMDLPNGVAGTARMTYNPAAYNCGSIMIHGTFWSNNQDLTPGEGYVLIFNYARDCGAATPPPGPKPGAAVLKVTCTGNQATLTWNIPAGATENIIRKIVNGATQVEAFSDPTKTKTTFTETFVPTTQYLHKSSPSAISNIVQCPGGGGSGGGPTPTPVYPPLTCAPINQTVALRQNATVTATGGSGTYQWTLSGSGVQQGGTATSVDVSYTVSGQKVVRVSSGGQIATCVVTVTGTGGEALPTLAVIKRGLNASTGSGTGTSAITVNPNEIAQFTVSITNNGTTAVTGLRVADTLPPGMSYRAGSTTINGQAGAGDTITSGGLMLDTLELGANVNIQWMATADATGQLAAGPQQSQPQVLVTATDTADATADMSVTVYGSGFAGATDSGTVGGIETGPGDAVTIALVMAAALTLLYSGYTRSAAYRRHEADVVSNDQGPMDFRS